MRDRRGWVGGWEGGEKLAITFIFHPLHFPHSLDGENMRNIDDAMSP